MKAKIFGMIILGGLLLAGCGGQETVNVDIENDAGKAIMGLDFRDFEQAASQMVQSLLRSNALNRDGGGRYIVATGRIVNDTMLRIDTDQLMAKVEIDILNSGKAVMTSAIGPGSDEMLHETRQLRESDEFNQDTTAAKNTLIAPDFTIDGKIMQKNVDYSRNTEQSDYYFQLKLNDVDTGLRYWQDEVILSKRGKK